MRYFMLLFIVSSMFGLATLRAQDNPSHLAVLELDQKTDLVRFERNRGEQAIIWAIRGNYSGCSCKLKFFPII